MQSYERRGCPINYYKMGRVKEKAIIVTKKYEIRFIIMNFLNKQGWDVLVEKYMFPEYGKIGVVKFLVSVQTSVNSTISSIICSTIKAV